MRIRILMQFGSYAMQIKNEGYASFFSDTSKNRELVYAVFFIRGRAYLKIDTDNQNTNS